MNVPDAAPRRVSVVGSTGTGKTTFARALASALDVPSIELDALFWGPNWSMAEPAVLRQRALAAIAGDRWVVDGNYGGAGVRELVWERADTIIWLDYSLPVIYARLWRRTIARIRDGRELWPATGNRETIRGAFFSRESMFVYALTRYRLRRSNYPRLFALPQYASKTRLRFRRPAEAARWLDAERRRASAGI